MHERCGPGGLFPLLLRLRHRLPGDRDPGRTGIGAVLAEACARICEECAAECAKHDDAWCRECADVCRRGAEACRKLAASAA